MGFAWSSSNPRSKPVQISVAGHVNCIFISHHAQVAATMRAPSMLKITKSCGCIYLPRVASMMSAVIGSETRNASGDRHSHVSPDEHMLCVQGLSGWIEHQASDSEAIVKAENHSEPMSIDELQATSVEHFRVGYRSSNTLSFE